MMNVLTSLMVCWGMPDTPKADSVTSLIIHLLEKICPSEHHSILERIKAMAAKGDNLNGKSGYCVPACFEGTPGLTEALAGWIEARRAKKNPPTGRAIQMILNRVAERPHQAVAALDMAAERGWSTIKWDWFDKEQPAKDKGEYKEATRLPVIWP